MTTATGARTERVGGRERPALHDRDAERLEKVAGRRVEKLASAFSGSPSTNTYSFQKPPVSGVLFDQRRHPATPGSAATRFLQVLAHDLQSAPRIVGHAGCGCDRLDLDDVLIEAGIDGQQVVERPREQQRADQQHQRQRDLRHHQRRAQAESLARLR